MNVVSFPYSDEVNKILITRPVSFPSTNVMKITALLSALEIVLKNKIPGDIVELGCETGESSVYIRLMLDHYKESSNREYHVYDSWEGVPELKNEDLFIDSLKIHDPFTKGSCTSKLSTFTKKFESEGLIPPVIHTGWFSNIPDRSYPKHIAFAYYDGDLYQSIIDSFDKTFNKMSKGGHIVIDDYDYPRLPGCKKAVTDFLSDKKEKEIIIDNYSDVGKGVLIVKGGELPELKSSDLKYKILYGSPNSYMNVTYLLQKYCENFKYPHLYFGDHLIGKNKEIIIKLINHFELHISTNGMLMVKNIKNFDDKLLKIFYGAANYYRDVTHLLLDKTPSEYKSPNDIFGDHLVGHHKTLRIAVSDTIIEINDRGEISNSTDRLRKSLSNNNKKIIAFHQEHLSERGTSVAIYDYADYNEKLLGNKSIIIYKKNHSLTHTQMKNRFKSRFNCFEYENNEEINNIIINEDVFAFYNIAGENVRLPIYNCRNLTHSVFSGVMTHGDVHCAISEVVSDFLKVVPHMVSLSIEKDNPTKDNMRKELGIPEEATVIGRHGGKYSFDIESVKDYVKKLVDSNENIWFLFLNTECFIKHDRVIHLESTVDPHLKCKFILTCDAMLHASRLGETFGLAIAEFSVCNKPIITTTAGELMHLRILNDKALIYDDFNSLKEIITNIKSISSKRKNWNAYEAYSPENVMEIFNDIFLS